MLRLAMAIAMATVIAGNAVAQTPPDVADLVGARGASGETQLEARGYRHITTNTVRDTKWSFWWNERRRQCLSVATADGRYSAIGTVPGANCDAAVADTAAATPPYPGGERGDRIDLVCIGSGSSPAAQSTSGYRYNSDTGQTESQYGTTLVREGFSSDVELDISSGRGRIRPTGQLVSPIHSGGVDGWWQIDGLVVAPDRIIGSYRMNGLNRPRFEYDRRTRILRINAATNFTGRCEEQ